MSAAIDILTNALGGGLIGSITGAGIKITEIIAKQKELAIQREIAKDQNAHEIELMRLRNAGAKTEAEISAQSAQILASYEALEKSYEHDRATYATVDTTKTSPWLVAVDFVRGIVRPAITGFLVAFSTFLVVYFMYTSKVPLAQDQLYGVVMQLINNLTTCTGLAISWYFVTRPHNRSGS